MIPKIIHYCWFGGKPLPRSMQRYIKSWQKYCPDYKICRWDESNFDVQARLYTRQAYEAKKFAFVSDVARLWILVNEGGIYLDTDVEVVKPLDEILSYRAVSGFEDGKNIPTGLMACEKGFALFEEFLHEYDHLPFIRQDRSYDLTTNVIRITAACKKRGLVQNNTQQTVDGFTLLPQAYFCPKNYETGRISATPNTLTIHHFKGSWLHVPLRVKIYWFLYAVLGIKLTRAIQRGWQKVKGYLK